MEKFIEDTMKEFYPSSYKNIYKKSPLLQYLNLKSSAIHGNSKSRRSLGNIYAIYSILYFYLKDGFSILMVMNIRNYLIFLENYMEVPNFKTML